MFDRPNKTGTTSTDILFEPFMGTQFTVFNLCKYKELGTKRAIIQGEDVNSVFGFWYDLCHILNACIITIKY